jgi:hypothetical protein
MLTLELLLARSTRASRDTFDDALDEEAAIIAADIPEGSTVGVFRNLRDHREEAQAAGNSLVRFEQLLETGLVPNHTKIKITSFDAAIEVTLPAGAAPEPLLSAIGGLSDRLGTALEPSRSAAVFGPDHPIVPGVGAVRLFVCLHRTPGLTLEEFLDWWLNQLIAHTTKTPGKSAYRQLHTDRDLTHRAAKAAGVGIDDVDGVALEWYPDLERLYSAVDWADQPNAPIIQAETQAIDFARAKAILTYSDHYTPPPRLA